MRLLFYGQRIYLGRRYKPYIQCKGIKDVPTWHFPILQLAQTSWEVNKYKWKWQTIYNIINTLGLSLHTAPTELPVCKVSLIQNVLPLLQNSMSTPKTEQCKTKWWLVFLLEANSAKTVQFDKTLYLVITNFVGKLVTAGSRLWIS
jgi:hypothetical protein